MKVRPHSHKSENTFKFQTFAERISNINIDVIHRIGRTSLLPEDVDTFFLEALEKWEDLNYTDDYSDLKKDIGFEVRSLTQLLHRQEELVRVLQNHLKNGENLALDATLDLVVALARDLQFDFYPHFSNFFALLLDLVSTQNTERLERVFTCLAHLFKVLWRYMIKDIHNVYKMYSPLLSSERKVHVRIFASESFAFLLRKVPDKKQVLEMIFERLGKKPNQAEGVGQLMFEMLRGVKKQFHSCTETVFPIMLQLLGGEGSGPSLVQKALIQMADAMTQHTSVEFCDTVWKVFCDAMNAFVTTCPPGSERWDHLERLLSVVFRFISYRNCALVGQPSPIVLSLRELMKLEHLTENCAEHLLSSFAFFFLFKDNLLKQTEILDSLNVIFSNCPSRTLLFDFIIKLFPHSMFEKHILPLLLSYCDRELRVPCETSFAAILGILTKLILEKRGTLSCGRDLDSWPKYNLQIKRDEADGETPSIQSMILESLDLDATENMEERASSIWASLVCVPHIRPIETSLVQEKLKQLGLNIWKKLMGGEWSDASWERGAFLLAETVAAYVQTNASDTYQAFPAELFIDLLSKKPSCVNILRALDIFLSDEKRLHSEVSSTPILEKTFPLLQPNLASPYHRVRFLTLRILSNFDLPLPKLDNENLAQTSVFKICLSAEEVPIGVQEYRLKLRFLQKLEYETVQQNLPIGPYQWVPLYYLVGMLYVNFKLLWQPTQKLIDSHAKGMGKGFWDVFGPHLKDSAKFCEKCLLGELLSTVTDEPELLLPNSLGHLFADAFRQVSETTEIPDHQNQRSLLWQAMESFSEMAEPRNRELVPLLLDFFKKEFLPSDIILSRKEDITTGSRDMMISVNRKTSKKGKKWFKSKKSFHSQSKNTADDDFLDENSVSEKQSPESETLKRTKRATSRMLCCHLGVFSKFQNPRALLREEDLHNLYLELLTHRDADVQKLAFDCLMTYKPKYLLPYKANFSNLLDDKSFKTEIVLFSIDSEHGVVLAEDRQELLPVLMRVLYGKMLRKTGANTSGKSNAQLRRSIVLRFLGGCSEQELQVFLQLVFAPFVETATEEPLAVVAKTKETIDPSSVVPIKRMLSILNTLGVVFGQLGNLLSGTLPWLLNIVLSTSSLAAALLDHRSQIHPSQVLLLKSLRTLSTERLIQFFTTFDQYPFATNEIEAIFQASVWPLLPHLEQEALYHPPPLLRLLAIWSQNPRYFTLLGKRCTLDSKLQSPLHHLLALYTADKVQYVVVNTVTEILCQLLTFRDYVQDLEDTEGTRLGPEIPVDCASEILVPEDFAHLDEPPNLGTLLLLPYVPQILLRLETLIGRTVRNPKKLLSSNELTILTRISEHVQDSKQSASLVALLIPFLTKPRSRNQESEVKILTTVRNLIKYAENRKQFIRPLASLFSTLSSRQSRSALCSIFTSAAEIDPSLTGLASVVEKINAWNPKQAEEPDYNARLKGYREAQHIFGNMDDETLDVDFILVVVYNCSFFVRFAEDLSLRDNSSYTLQLFSEKMGSLMETQKIAFRTLVSEAAMNEIKKGLRNKNEVVRSEFVTILASLLRHCGTHAKLKPLAQLCDPDIDLDFWENIRHIQLHRRARALTRVARSLTSGTLVIPTSVLSSYVMPLATCFLFDSTYAKHSNLVDAAVETIGAICQLLPWQQYETTLKYYIGQLTKNAEFHKLVVKIIVAVLNAFHFDLSNYRAPLTQIHLPKEKDDPKEGADDTETDISMIVEEGEEIEESDHTTGTCGKKLSEESSTKIHDAIVRRLLPQLHRCLTQKAKREEEHKLVRNSYPEDEEILRIPIALAMVKLLQNLPHGMLEDSISGIFLKVVQLLRSRADSIRDGTREMLNKMMQSLGPKYFRYLLHEMKSIMKRGYQVHVMTYTIHSVLANLVPHMKTGDLDCSIDSLTQICQEELFGEAAEEKEVDKIAGKLKEARSSKSYGMYQIMAQFCSESALESLVSPLREALAGKHSHKAVRKLQDCLRHIVLGLADNSELTTKSLLIFVHGIVSSGIQDDTSLSTKPTDLAESEVFKRPDVYLIPQEPKRSGNPARFAKKTNSHVLVDFGLQLLHFLLKREKLQPSCKEHLEMLDPFIPILTSCLNSHHAKVIATALRCFAWLPKFPIPSMQTHIVPITNAVFVLLNKYCGAGMGQGDNFEMVVMCFKVLTVIIRDVSYHEVNSKQLRVLLVYVDQDVHDHTRQATAFTLLKAILSRRLQADELPGIMKKICDMSITSEQEHIRNQSRQVFLQYLMEYPLGKAIPKFLGFYILQLDYNHEYGRESALEMLNSVFASFPYGLLKKHSGLFLLPLSARLVNDASSKCRQMAAMAIKNLLSKLEDNDRTKLFSIVTTWLQSEKMTHQKLGAQLCGLFAESEGEKFAGRISTLLPLFESSLDPENYKNVEFQGVDRNSDHLLYQLLNSLLKVMTACSIVRSPKYQPSMTVIWDHVCQHLQHAHSWVRLAASQLFGLLFSVYPAEELAKAVDADSSHTKDYLLTDSCQKVLDLAANFCAQFHSSQMSEKLGEQIVRNLVYLAKTITHLQPKTKDDKGVGGRHRPTVTWMFRRLCRDLNAEVALTPKVTLKRTCVFKWIAAVALEMKEDVMQYLGSFLPPLCRELADRSPYTDQELKTLAQEVVDLLRAQTSVDRFSEEYVRAQASLNTKKATRKRKKAMDAVSNPEVNARRKIKKHLSKKVARKRKMDQQKGGGRHKGKKPRLSDVIIDG